MTATAPATVDKRDAILTAALRLIARSGLHNIRMSALADEVGVGAGTLYRYFPSKEAMINDLYLEALRDRHRAITGERETESEWPGDPRAALWRHWHGHARWHLSHPDASNVILQCETSGILTPETRETQQRLQAENVALLREAFARGYLRDLPWPIFWALAAGPIFVLSQMQETGEIEVTDDVLAVTFDGVCRSVLPGGGA